jgi:hypothetical protein
MEKNEEDDWWCWGVIGALAVAASLAVWLPILILSWAGPQLGLVEARGLCSRIPLMAILVDLAQTAQDVVHLRRHLCKVTRGDLELDAASNVPQEKDGPNLPSQLMPIHVE